MNRVNKLLKILVVLGVIICVIVLGLYFYKFAPNNWFALSGHQETWGQFGDFIGGTLNPIFSLLTFFGLLVTISLQISQTDEGRKKAHLDDLQRLMSTTSAAIDALLRTSPKLHKLSKAHGTDETNMTVFEHIAKMGHSAGACPPEEEITSISETYKLIIWDICPFISAICDELSSLAWVLEKYNKTKGHEDFLEFYRMRYLMLIVWLKDMGELRHHPMIDKVFEPEEYKASIMQHVSEAIDAVNQRLKSSK